MFGGHLPEEPPLPPFDVGNFCAKVDAKKMPAAHVLGQIARFGYLDGMSKHEVTDRQKIEPLFPFGYGLSYTTFAYSGLRAEKTSLQATKSG